MAIAIYGAAVASIGIGWQIYTWRQAHKNKVAVHLSNAFLSFPSGLVDAVQVTVVNKNDHSVRVSGWGLVMQNSSGTLARIIGNPYDEIPGDVPAHDSKSGWMLFKDIIPQGIDIYRPLVGSVNLATGENIRSKPATLRRR